MVLTECYYEGETAERGRERKRNVPTISDEGKDSKEREDTGYR